MEATPSPFAVIPPKQALKYLLYISALVGILLTITLTYLLLYSQPPDEFPVAKEIDIEAGSSITTIVKKLKAEHVVESETLLYVLLLSQYEPSDIKASTYVFDKPYNVFAIANKLATGDFTSNLVRLTHKEGEPVTLLAKNVHAVLPNISEEQFITAALPYEGQLFPETYFLPPHYDASAVIAVLRAKYEEFMLTRRSQIASLGLTESEVIILASILERESNSAESMGLVSGILQNRLAIDMPLQTDASLEYVLNKPLHALTAQDLKMESPYNTYLNNGLPPTPIGNPGAVAITAILEPTPSDYLFYITDNDGVFHYAVTYEEHKRNIARYLK